MQSGYTKENVKSMMKSVESFKEQYKDQSYSQLIQIRDEILKSIIQFEKDENLYCDSMMEPSPNTIYQMNLLYLSCLSELIVEKFNQLDSKDYIIHRIDTAIRDIWENEIKEDYLNGNIFREDTLKNCIYYHLRKRIGKFLEKNNLKLYTEYYCPKSKYRADMAIVHVDPWSQENEEHSLMDSFKEIVLFELKFKEHNNQTEKDVRKDIQKIKNYLNKYPCYYYFIVIYEGEDDTIFWMNQEDLAWTKNFVTELAAGYVNGELSFQANPVVMIEQMKMD